MSDLKPCPFCGGSAAEVYSTNPAGFWFVKCDHVECGVRGPMNKDQQAAIDGWNLRAPDPAFAELLAVLVSAEKALSYCAVQPRFVRSENQAQFMVAIAALKPLRDAIAKAKEGAK